MIFFSTAFLHLRRRIGAVPRRYRVYTLKSLGKLNAKDIKLNTPVKKIDN